MKITYNITNNGKLIAKDIIEPGDLNFQLEISDDFDDFLFEVEEMIQEALRNSIGFELPSKTINELQQFFKDNRDEE